MKVIAQIVCSKCSLREHALNQFCRAAIQVDGRIFYLAGEPVSKEFFKRCPKNAGLYEIQGTFIHDRTTILVTAIQKTNKSNAVTCP